MRLNTGRRALLLTLCLGLLPVAGLAWAHSIYRDLWVHPRSETYDPQKHYVDTSGEPYYSAENDIQTSLGDLQNGEREVTVDLGPDLFGIVQRSKGSLLPVILVDTSNHGHPDKTFRGSIRGQQAVFDAAPLREAGFPNTAWQFGVRYVAGADGDLSLDGRYLASITSKDARVEGLPDVGAGPRFAPGLAIFKHRAGVPFDFADFIENPERYVEDFDRLTREADGDDWTAEGAEGAIVTHFEDEDLYLVRTEGDFDLDVKWGDVPFLKFLEDYMAVAPNRDACFSSLDTQLRNSDGTRTVVPHRYMYCPESSVALFDAPDGYEIEVAALRGGEVYERAEIGTSISDNVHLYSKEIYPRSARNRATGTVLGNVGAGFRDAGQDVGDMFRHGITGTYERDVHTGQVQYRPSPITAVPRALLALVTLKPFVALNEVFDGAESTIQIGADAVSAVDNSVVNPALQLTVGAAAGAASADTASHWFGATTQAVVKNIPGGERANTTIDPEAYWNHNRAFSPSRYTRTDTQLNIDRAMTLANIAAIAAIERHNDDSGSGCSGEGCAEDEEPEPPTKKKTPKTKKPKKKTPKVKKPSKKTPKIKKPSKKTPKIKKPSKKTPKIKKPKVKKPHMKRPKVKKPHMKRPKVKKPHMKRPKVKKPHMKRPKVKKPHMKRPKVKKPHMKRPKVNHSGLGDGTNPGLGDGRSHSPNMGINNPGVAKRPSFSRPPRLKKAPRVPAYH